MSREIQILVAFVLGALIIGLSVFAYNTYRDNQAKKAELFFDRLTIEILTK